MEPGVICLLILFPEGGLGVGMPWLVKNDALAEKTVLRISLSESLGTN